MTFDGMTPQRVTTVMQDFKLTGVPKEVSGRGEEFVPDRAQVRVERSEYLDEPVIEVRLSLRGNTLPRPWDGTEAFSHWKYGSRTYTDLMRSGGDPAQMTLIPALYVSMVAGVVKLLDGLGD